MWTYAIKSGSLYNPSGVWTGSGYSGTFSYKNNPDATSLVDRGPIPAGYYGIGEPVDTVTHGPFVLPLEPDPNNEMYGRSGFLIHGDSVVDPGAASEGCIILNRLLREQIVDSGDRKLHVIPLNPEI